AEWRDVANHRSALHPAGIDWNCDGRIQSSVQENINGDGGNSGWFNSGSSTDTLTAQNDWTHLPYQGSSGCYILQDAHDRGSLFPLEYLNAMGNTDCTGVNAGDSPIRLPSPRSLV